MAYGNPGRRPLSNGFRLTGVSATPVMTADSSALSTIYLTPYLHNTIDLYDGSAWNTIESDEVSLAVTGRTTDLPFDIFVYDASGVPTLEFLDWTNATTRATALVLQNGVWCKSGALTRRYVGTCRPRSATTFHWVTVGDVNGAGGNTPVKLDLWNAYSRVAIDFFLWDSATSFNYSVATVQPWNNSANAQCDIVCGLQLEYLQARLNAHSSNTSANGRASAFGWDSTTAWAARSTISFAAAITTTPMAAVFGIQPAIGRHFMSWLQWASGTGTVTWIGVDATEVRSGLHGEWPC